MEVKEEPKFVDVGKWTVDQVVQWASNIIGTHAQTLGSKEVDGAALLLLITDTRLVVDSCGIPLGPALKLTNEVKKLTEQSQIDRRTSPKFWVSDAPVGQRNWHIPLEELHLKPLITTLQQKQFMIVHGHPRSGKTSHRLAIAKHFEKMNWKVLNIQFDFYWQHLPEDRFWIELKDHLSTSIPNIQFSNHISFSDIFKTNRQMCILFDEFQYVLDAEWKDSLLAALKLCRDNSQLTSFSGCLAFGTYDVTRLSTKEISLSPFASSNIYHLKAPHTRQMKSTLYQYRVTVNNRFSRLIINDILQTCGEHLGIYGLLCFNLDRLVTKSDPLPKNDGYLSLWKQRKVKFYLLMFGNPVFRDVIRLLVKDNNQLMRYIERFKLLSKDTFTMAEMEPEVETLLSFGVLTFVDYEKSITEFKWTSPLLKEFIINYAITTKSETPSAPLLESKYLDYSSLYKMLGKLADVNSIVSYDHQETEQFDPLEAGFQAEFYRVLKGIFLKTIWSGDRYGVMFEGRLCSGRRRFDLLISNGIKTVVELKIMRPSLSLNKVVVDGVNQAFYYAREIGAPRADLLICCNFECPSDSPLNIPLQSNDNNSQMFDEEYADYNEKEDSDYLPSQNDSDEMDVIPTVQVKIIFFQYSENWKRFIDCKEVEVKLTLNK
eukprot:TRINITY_DN3804_c0_g1_i1.p1 TRINITY_DN3804_c0_g1~~TRINITY_DN3804_c0_g1_i1.p1  ORF type:complete len:658 (-),score=61.62 TRINITY_DN3804_c0_g1_i1:59-2032(-)